MIHWTLQEFLCVAGEMTAGKDFRYRRIIDCIFVYFFYIHVCRLSHSFTLYPRRRPSLRSLHEGRWIFF